ncbi:uncharacterized protein [Musca autumnalis]|uniref:uncharacterized protein n=1 Tax=Musca autumnalis TaxID=221902 RepID=UPI003CF86D4F
MTKMKSHTALLCEITRLRAQQKYLEANQIKISPNNFCNDSGSHVSSTGSNEPNELVNTINEINNLKGQHETETDKFRLKTRNIATDICREVKQLREDTKPEKCLENLSIDAIRARIISINTRIDALRTKNTNEIKALQNQYPYLEKEAQISFY